MKRRDLLKRAAACIPFALAAERGRAGQVRPGEAAIGRVPAATWEELQQQLGDRLQRVDWPFDDCLRDLSGVASRVFFAAARNPFFLGDHPGLTQTFGWSGAWTVQPSERVVVAQTAEDVAAAVRFARCNRVPLVVKGGGHSYKGGSNAAGSLLVWTRRMNAITLLDAFVPTGSPAEPVPAVEVGAGAMWGEVYRAVCVRGGRYVQGGGCLTVGVAGLIQSGGFGSFSKAYGLAASGLLEAEVVTADGEIRIVNEAREPELFFALKGGGGGTFGIVTRLVLRTHDLPETFGAVFMEIRARSGRAFRALSARILDFCATVLLNPHWGEQIRFRPDNSLSISMVFQGFSQDEAEAVWAPLLDWLRSRPEDYRLDGEPVILAVPARSFFDADFLKALPGVVLSDTQPGADRDRIFWASNREEAGQVIHAYRSAWLPASLLDEGRRSGLVDGLMAASRHWSVALHLNKGLAGAPQWAREAARDTAINPAACDAFALLLCAAEGPPAYPGVNGFEPDTRQARFAADRVAAAMTALHAHVPVTGSYLAESNYFERNWQEAFWGANHDRLEETKRRYDPVGLLTVHHGVGGG
jgi:hypothetical protein